MSADEDFVAIRKFAVLDGCNEALVRRAIKQGKLRVSEDGKVDASQAGTGWRKANRKAAPGADKGADKPKKSAPKTADTISSAMALAELGDEDFIAAVLAGRFAITGAAEMVKENALAGKHLLAMRRDAGDVVDLEVAEAVLFEQARQFRDAWMNWPVRVGPLIAAELGVSADPVVETLNKHVQQQLNDLGEPDPEFAGRES